MRRLWFALICFIVGYVACLIVTTTIADPTDISPERLWNAVYDSTNNRISVKGV